LPKDDEGLAGLPVGGSAFGLAGLPVGGSAFLLGLQKYVILISKGDL
jgi:hypothetical protein